MTSCRKDRPPTVSIGEMSSVSIDAATLRRLVADAQQGDRAAADRLIRQHTGWVRSAVYAVTGRTDLLDDVVQQVWARVWERLPTLDDPARLRSWLYSVARNAAIDACRNRQREASATTNVESGEMVSADRRPPTPDGQALGNELRSTLLRAVQALPVVYREPLVLRHLEGWSYAEIAQVLGVTVESVETRLIRARRLLRDMLSDKVEL